MNPSTRVTLIFLSLLSVQILFGCTERPENSAETYTSEKDKANAEKDAEPRYIDWTELLPEEDLKALEAPPAYIDDIEDGSLGDTLASQLKMAGEKDSKAKPSTSGTAPTPTPEPDAYQQALTSTRVREEFDGRAVRLGGFIVPVEFDDQQTITTFFLVPFFGACLHLPPPPPNQIVYAEYEPGIQLDNLYEPYVISGKLATTLFENDIAIAAYSMSVSHIITYQEAANAAQDNGVE